MAKKNEPGKSVSDARAQLEAKQTELEALRTQVEDLEQAADAAEQNEGTSTRRGVLQAAWAAPVIMSVNLPNAVFAASAVSPVSTPSPTGIPTPLPMPTTPG
ncbi:MAG: hypothetical protein P1V21_03840 [Rhizobiaceae bacterium]|nr:hypothetical protein [Rhizobiaceae bacterium]